MKKPLLLLAILLLTGCTALIDFGGWFGVLDSVRATPTIAERKTNTQ